MDSLIRMGAQDRCSICGADSRDEMEELGRQALAGELSWRKASFAAGGVNPTSLKNHMLRHVVAPEVAEAEEQARDEMDALIDEAKQGLMEQFYVAPPDVKPLILVAIQNLDALRATRPSQDNLIKALKTIQEMTGMKNEQRLMLGFAKAMFSKQVAATSEPVAVESREVPALPVGG